MKNMNDLLDKLYEVRTELKELTLKESELKKVKNELEAMIIANNWDEFQAYIVQTGRFELMQKRASATSYRELQQMGENVPGVEPTELTKVNFRSK